jgi:hypothetical protein
LWSDEWKTKSRWAVVVEYGQLSKSYYDPENSTYFEVMSGRLTTAGVMIKKV